MTEEPWFVPALWVGGITKSWSPIERRIGDRYLAVPSRTDVRQLLPWRWSSAVAAGQRRSDDRGRNSSLRDIGRVAALLTVGATTRSRRVAVEADASIVDHVAAELGLPKGSHGLFLFGPERANRKPVLQLHDHLGRTRAWVKVGTSDLTRRLLNHEVEVLSRLGAASFGFRVPRVEASGTFGSSTWAALEPMTVGRRRRPHMRAFDDLALAIERTAPRWSGPAEESPMVARLRDESIGLEHASIALERLVGRGREVTLAAAHGDLVPWNLLSGSPQPAVWDWERYERTAPVGFDRIHRRIQVAVQRSGHSLERAVSDTHHEMRGHGDLPADRWADHIDWYLVVMLCRYERDAQRHPNPRLVARIADLARVLNERGTRS